MNIKNKTQLLIINIILVCLLLNIVATISQIASIDQVSVGEIVVESSEV